MSLQEQVKQLQAQLKAAQAKNGNGQISFKVSQKGCLSVYGMGRFPVSLYRGQWERLLDHEPQLRAFIKANSSKLATKE